MCNFLLENSLPLVPNSVKGTKGIFIILMFLSMLICFCTCANYRGKGDYYRLGTDSNAPVKEPQQVEALTKKVVQIAVGSLHCLALTDNGEVRNI